MLFVWRHEMTRDDLVAYGWRDDSINIGLIADVDYFAFFEEDEVPYEFWRHYKGDYEIVHGVTVRGVYYGSALCAWTG